MKTLNPNDAIEQALREAQQVDISWIQPPPTSDGWTLAPDALRFVTKMVELLRPRHVLEMGSGLSTRLLSREAAKLATKCVISSIDHDPQFNWEANGSIERNGAPVKFHLAPLVVRDFGGKLLGAYLIQPAKLATGRAADLVVIDGPPVNLGGREGTLYQVMDFARAGTVVLLDDSKRPEERAAIKAWQENLGDAITVRQLPGFAKGMAAVVVNKPVPLAELWQSRFELSRAEIERAVPQGGAFLLAGEAWWGKELGTARKIIPFTEHDGEYWGEPADDESAIAELDRLAGRGVRHFVFGWPSFWWLDYYKGFVAELERRGKRIVDHDRLVMFELRD
jgi:predicted O-methyltransferase YrrM